MDVIVVLVIIIVMMYLIYRKMPKTFKKEQTLGDAFEDVAAKLFHEPDFQERKFFMDLINEKFDEAAKSRNEVITTNQKLKILAEILLVKKMSGRDFALKHLEYELKRFIQFGIRKDNKGLL